MVTYEELLGADSLRAMSESSRYFEERSAVQDALRRITLKLRELQVPYAVVGGMALFVHGLRRFTEDVDILVTEEDLRKVHFELDGLGYLRPFAGSKNLRDTETGVRIEFLITGQFPGDGRPKPVAFPHPGDVAFERDGISYVNLPVLVDLKLASGMTNSDRIKDLADVQELIKLLTLPEDFAGRLAPYVRAKYLELWKAARPVSKRYLLVWRNKSLTAEASSVAGMAAALQKAAETLQAMLADGVVLDPGGSATDDYAHLVTTDPEVARKYGMHDESEYLDTGDAAGE